jgi:hypothetical protein
VALDAGRESENLGLTGRTSEFDWRNRCAQIRDRSRRRRDGNPKPTCPHRADDRCASVDDDASASSTPARARHTDFDRSVRSIKQVPKGGRAAVAQDRRWAEGKRRGHPAAMHAQAGVSDGVDPSVNPVQPSQGDPPADGAVVEPAFE